MSMLTAPTLFELDDFDPAPLPTGLLRFLGPQGQAHDCPDVTVRYAVRGDWPSASGIGVVHHSRVHDDRAAAEADARTCAAIPGAVRVELDARKLCRVHRWAASCEVVQHVLDAPRSERAA